MLDFGWPEMFLIMAVAVIVIGPNEIPALMVGLGRIVRRLQYIKYAISQQFDDVMREADLDDIRKSVNFEAQNFEKEHGIEAFDEAEADEDIEWPEDQEERSENDRQDSDEKDGGGI